MMGHPGKKLLFMGQEFGTASRMEREERDSTGICSQKTEHQRYSEFVSRICFICIQNNKALYEMDNDPAGFEWINADDAYRSIFSLIRKSPTKRNNLLFVVNYTPVDRPDYRVGVPKKKQYKLIMDENGLLDKPKIFKAEEQECDHREYSFNYFSPGIWSRSIYLLILYKSGVEITG